MTNSVTESRVRWNRVRCLLKRACAHNFLLRKNNESQKSNSNSFNFSPHFFIVYGSDEDYDREWNEKKRKFHFPARAHIWSIVFKTLWSMKEFMTFVCNAIQLFSLVTVFHEIPRLFCGLNTYDSESCDARKLMEDSGELFRGRRVKRSWVGEGEILVKMLKNFNFCVKFPQKSQTLLSKSKFMTNFVSKF